MASRVKNKAFVFASMATRQSLHNCVNVSSMNFPIITTDAHHSKRDNAALSWTSEPLWSSFKLLGPTGSSSPRLPCTCVHRSWSAASSYHLYALHQGQTHRLVPAQRDHAGWRVGRGLQQCQDSFHPHAAGLQEPIWAVNMILHLCLFLWLFSSLCFICSAINLLMCLNSSLRAYTRCSGSLQRLYRTVNNASTPV